MNVLLIINDPAYGTEKAYNALRLAMALQKDHAPTRLRVFLMADAVTAAVAGQKTPDGYYNLERMLRSVAHRGAEVALCGSCLDARGLADASFVSGAHRGSMALLAEWTAEADKVLTF